MKNFHSARSNVTIGERHKHMKEVARLLADAYGVKVKIIFRDRRKTDCFVHRVSDKAVHTRATRWSQIETAEAMQKWAEEVDGELWGLVVVGQEDLTHCYYSGYNEYATVEEHVPTGHRGMKALDSIVAHEVAHVVDTIKHGRPKGEQHPDTWLAIYKEMLYLLNLLDFEDIKE